MPSISIVMRISICVLFSTTTAAEGQLPCGSGAPEARSCGLAVEALREIRAGRSERGAELLRHALDLTSDRDQKAVAHLSSVLGSVLVTSHRSEGVQYLQQADSLCRTALDVWDICDSNRRLLFVAQAMAPPEDRLAEKMSTAAGIVQAGDPQRAIGPLEEALDEARRAGNLVGEAMLSGLLGAMLFNADLTRALGHLQRAGELCQGVAQTLPICADVELMLAMAQRSVGIESSINIRSLISNFESENPALRAMAQVFSAESDEEFLAAMVVMLETASEAGVLGEKEARFYRELGTWMTGAEQRSPDEAEAAVAQIPEMLARNSELLPPGSAKYQLGLLAAGRGDLERAEALLYAAHEEALDAEATFLQGPILRLLAGVQWALDHRRQARETLAKALHIDQARELELLLRSPLNVHLEQSFALTIEQLVQYEAWSGLPRAAFDRADALKARTLLAHLGHPRSSPTRPDHPLRRRMEAKRRQLRDLEEALRNATGRARVEAAAELETARQDYLALLIEQRLQIIEPEAGIDRKSHYTPLSDLMAEMDDTTLVAFFTTWEELLIWVVDAERFAIVTVRIPSRALEDRIRSFVAFTSRGSVAPTTRGGRGAELLSRTADASATAEALYELLITPIRPLLRRSRLVVVPHGILHALPFSALRDPASGRYLAEDFALGNVPSVEMLVRLQEQGPERPGGSALVVGNPSTSLGDLPGAEREARAVAAALGTRPLLRDQALESVVRRRLSTASWVHFAAHAMVQEENPYFSRLELVADAGPDGHDGHLEIHEILTEVDLDTIELVVLSGCETAIGETTRGDEIIGLGRAFLYAGSPAVVSTLWWVDDASTAFLMRSFYEHLRAGVPYGEALRRAQLETARQPRWSDPYYWAAFVLTGDPGIRWTVSES